MNAPDRMDALRLPEGMAKITITPDEKIVNAALFVVAREDHTVGNLMRMCVSKWPSLGGHRCRCFCCRCCRCCCLFCRCCPSRRRRYFSAASLPFVCVRVCAGSCCATRA